MTGTISFGPLEGAPARRRAERARQVADALRPALASRADGDLLPPENDLATDFAVSRNTVREALDLLRREGLIDRIPGVGTVVTSAASRRVVPAPTSVAARLGLRPGDPVVYVERLRLADDRPVAIDLTYALPDPRG